MSKQRREAEAEDWFEYKRQDNRKFNHDKDRAIRDKKHRYSEEEPVQFIATQIFR